MGKKGKNYSHIICRRCGKRSYNAAHKTCASCGFGATSTMRKYTWQTKKAGKRAK